MADMGLRRAHTSMTTMPKVPLFDLGGVLMDFAGLRRLQAVLPDPLSEDQLHKRWLASASVRAFEVGRISPSAFAERFVRGWSLEHSPTCFPREFRTWARGFYPGAEALLDELRRRLRHDGLLIG